MNKKIWGIVGATVLSLTVTTPVAFANEKEDTSNMQLAAYSLRGQADANQIINFAKQQLGKPYSWGSTGPNSFDCSGFIYYVFSHNGYSISRTSVAGYWGNSNIQKVSTPKEGDLIFFKGTYGGSNHPSHIGIVINDHQFIQASSTRGVCITDINNSYWKRHFLGYGRIIPEQANKLPVYRVETGGFIGKDRVQKEVQVLKDKFGWNGEIALNDNKNTYNLETGGFIGIDRVQKEVQVLKDKFRWNGEIALNTGTLKYTLETGGFTGMDKVQNAAQVLKDKFGWNGEIAPNGNKPNEYKLVVNGFESEEAVKDAQRKLQELNWWSTYVPDPSNNYKIVIKGFESEEAVKDAQRKLQELNCWSTYKSVPSENYKIVINGFVGEEAAKDAQRKLQELGCWSTYIFTGEYRNR